MPPKDPATAGHNIRLRDVARGLWGILPHTPAAATGIAHLLRLRLGLSYSIGRLLEAQAARRPQATALRAGDQHWSYGTFNAWANRCAEVFAQGGIQSGDVVALCAENDPAILAAVAGLAKLGAVAGMLNPDLRGPALQHAVAAMNPKGLLCTAALIPVMDAVDGLPPSTQRWALGGNPGLQEMRWQDFAQAAATAHSENPQTTGKVRPEQACFYMLTSGTTGLPKASIMTHRRWLQGMAGLGRLSLRLSADDVLYCALPLHHNNALTVSWGAAMGAGAALALDARFSASNFWNRARHYDATAFSYIGELCRYLLAQPATPDDRRHRVRCCIGNGLRPEIWSTFKQRFGLEHICEFYASSEGNLAFVNAFNVDATAGYCPYDYAVVRCDDATAQPLPDAQGHLQKVPAGGTGLLLTAVSDNSPFDGYTDSAATDSKVLRNAFSDGDCWFNTGDLVRDQGWHHIQFVDRLGDTFRWKGENVASTEVEAVLSAAAGISACAVYGVRVPSADGRAGMAALVLAPGQALDPEGLAELLRARLPAAAVPRFLRVVPTLDMTATFKTRKHDLREAGCNPADIEDPLYVLPPAAKSYTALTDVVWQQICRGALKL